MTTTAGVVLCGGQSRRMGRPKADLPFGSETLLQRIVRIMRDVVRPVVVGAAAGQNLPWLPDDVLVSRDVEIHAGPVAGLRAAVTCLPGVSHVIAVGCDAPLISPALLKLLLAHVEPDVAVVPVVGGIRQPLLTVYPRHRLATCASAMPSLQEFLNGLNVREIGEADLRAVDPQLAAFAPLNTVAEYHDALRYAEG